MVVEVGSQRPGLLGAELREGVVGLSLDDALFVALGLAVSHERQQKRRAKLGQLAGGAANVSQVHGAVLGVLRGWLVRCNCRNKTKHVSKNFTRFK